MEFLPLFHNVQEESCAVVGGGSVALRKIRLLQSAGARVTVIASEIQPEVASAVTGQGGHCRLMTLSETSLIEDDALHELFASSALVVAATNDAAVNSMVSAMARMHNTPVNVVDDPLLSTCIFPSTLERGPVTVAVSSGGHAPVLSRLLRARMESLLPPSLASLAEAVAQARDDVRSIVPDIHHRRRFWDALLQDVLHGNAAAGQITVDAVLAQANAWQSVSTEAATHSHTLTLTSTNPEDLRLRELRWLQTSDVILHEASVPPAILGLARRDAVCLLLDPLRHEAQCNEHIARGQHVTRIFFTPGD